MGKTKEKKPRMLEQPAEPQVRREVMVTAYEERCTSPSGRRQITHRTDVFNGDLHGAQDRSRAFQQKYTKQNWAVIVRAVTVQV